MPRPLLAYSPVDLFLTAWYRPELIARPEPVCAGVEVDRVEPPDGDFPKRLLVIRDDGGPETSFITGERSVGLSVLAGSKKNPQDAIDLARIVFALRARIPTAGYEMQIGATTYRNPITAVLEANGPYAVDEAQDRGRMYMTLTLGVAAELL